MSDQLNLVQRYLQEHEVAFVMLHSQGLMQGNERGVRPMYEAVKYHKDKMNKAIIADKVIGKAGAMLAASGGIQALYTPLITYSGLEVLEQAGAAVRYDKAVEAIQNRAGDDVCPMEKIVARVQTVEELLLEIEAFYRELGIL